MRLTLRMLDWRIGGAIVGRTDGAGLCSSSVRLRFVSPDGCIVLGLEGAGRWLGSSSIALLGGLAGFGCGWLTDRLNGWTEPNREAGLEACEAGLSGWCIEFVSLGC